MKFRWATIMFLGLYLLRPNEVLAETHTRRLMVSVGNQNILITRQDNKKINKQILVADHLSSTKQIINENGEIITQPIYYPYGTSTTSLNLDKTSRYYTNQRKVDDDTDVYNYNARYYNPDTSVFIQPDVQEGPTRYTYVSGNPIMANDPSGNMEVNEGVEPPFTLTSESDIRRLFNLYYKLINKQITQEEQVQIFNIYYRQNKNYQQSKAQSLKGENGITAIDIANAKSKNELLKLLKQANPTIRTIELNSLDTDSNPNYDLSNNEIKYSAGNGENDQQVLNTLKHEGIHSLDFQARFKKTFAGNLITSDRIARKIYTMSNINANAVLEMEALAYANADNYLTSKYDQQGYFAIFNPIMAWQMETGSASYFNVTKAILYQSIANDKKLDSSLDFLYKDILITK